MKSQKPNKLAEYILNLTLPESESAFLMGDYEEEFNYLRDKKGILFAHLRFWILILESLPGFFKNSFYWGCTMFRNYLKTGIRNIKRQKGYSVINIAGLAIGLACCILILLWVRDELSFDKFHEKDNRLYRIICKWDTENATRYTASTPAPLGPALKENFPDIERCAMYADLGSVNVKCGEKVFRESYFSFVGKDFFEMFSFPLVKGDIKTVFSNPYSVVLSKATAKKYFKDEDPIGKFLTIDNQFDVIVTGVMKNFPKNSSIYADFVSPFEIIIKEYYGEDIAHEWDRHSFNTYVLLSNNVSAQNINQRIFDFKKKFSPESVMKLYIQPTEKMHLYSSHIGDSLYRKGDIRYVYLFSAIAVLILLIACINFMNLMTARSGRRAREVGIRKVAGASKRDIVKQFFGETLLLSFLALLISIILVYLILPGFNSLARKNLSLFTSDNLSIILWLAGITFLTGIFSGSYPSFYISAFQPVRILKNTLNPVSKGYRLRTFLVVTQFCLSIILIISALVLSRQISFLRNKDLGYNKEQLVSIVLSTDAGKRYELFKKELNRLPNVISVTGSDARIVNKNSSISGFEWEGMDTDNRTEFWIDDIDYNYIETLDIKLVEGRSFSKEFSDNSGACMLNEEAVRQMGIESPVGKIIDSDDRELKIIGVMKNFNFNPLHDPIEPLMFRFKSNVFNYSHVKIKPENISGTMKDIENIWKKINPDSPFRNYFIDDYFEFFYRTELRINTIFRWAALLGIFISCLGLVGLASFVAQKRTKEIGIRKVLGASVKGIIILMTKEFLKWVLLANIFAWPISWFLTKKLLDNFAYKTNVGVIIFLMSALFAFLTAIVAVSYQTIKAARTNPVDSLKYE